MICLTNHGILCAGNKKYAGDFRNAAGEREMDPLCGSILRDAGDLAGLAMMTMCFAGVESDNVEDGQASQGLLRAAGQQEGCDFHRRRQHACVRDIRRTAST